MTVATRDDWRIDPKDLAFLLGQGATEREAVLAAGFLDRVPAWRIGEVAGYGGGRSKDFEKQRSHWASAVSRAAKRGGRIVPRIQGLMDQLKHYRVHGEAPTVADEKEVMQALTNVIRSSSDAAIVSAAKTMFEMWRKGGETKTDPAKVVKGVVSRVGVERARMAFEALDCRALLVLLPEVDPAEAEAELVSELNGMDWDERLSRLEGRA